MQMAGHLATIATREEGSKDLQTSAASLKALQAQMQDQLKLTNDNPSKQEPPQQTKGSVPAGQSPDVHTPAAGGIQIREHP